MGRAAPVTQFDVIVFLLLAVSAGVGFFRGAVREVVALVALFVAAGIAIFGLPAFAPIFHHAIHSAWLATLTALVAVFLTAFIALRLIGAGVAQAVQSTQMLGFLDRSLGLLIGLGRGLLVLGALFLMFTAATPEDLRPRWITGSHTWPLASNMGRLLSAAAPKGLDLAGRLKPAFARAIHDASGDRSATEGYEAPEPASPHHPERTR